MGNMISVSRALKKLPILEKRIREAIRNTKFVFTTKGEPDIPVNGMPTYQVIEQTKSAYQSLIDMINEYAYIKSQITKSNAETTVEICGKNYTVAELLEMKKNSLFFKEELVDVLQRQLTNARKVVETENDKLVTKATDMVQKLMGEKESKSEKYLEMLDSIVNKEKMIILDPINAHNQINELTDFINQFLEDIDSVLDESNATTMIKAF